MSDDAAAIVADIALDKAEPPLSDHLSEQQIDSLELNQSEQNKPIEEQFLQLYLTANLPMLLSVHQLVEILTVPIGQIVPLFQMPPWIMGVYNWRGEVLWMVDLNHCLGLSPWYKETEYQSKHTVVVVRSLADKSTDEKDRRLGLVVHQIKDMVFCPSDRIQNSNLQSILEAANIPSTVQPFLHQYWQSADGTSFILDAETILETMPN